MDKGGGENAYPQNVDEKTCFFFNPSLSGLPLLQPRVEAGVIQFPSGGKGMVT